MLPRPGLGDDAVLPQAQREQRLPECVVDLVSAGVVEVLALEVQAQPASFPAAATLQLGSKAVGAIDRRGTADEGAQELTELGPEGRIGAQLAVGELEVEQRGHQRLGHETAAEGAIDAPASGGVRFEQAGVHRSRPDGNGGSVEPGCVGTLDEERHG